MWNIVSAITYLNNEASKTSQGKCAKYVRLAIKSGGIDIIPPPLRKGYAYPAAADYGASLIAKGFKIVYNHEGGAANLTDTMSVPGQQAGDIVVIKDIAGHIYGHMAMFNGTQWVSDFKQLNGFYPASAYRAIKSAFIMYRYEDTESTTPPAEETKTDNKNLHICYPITKNAKGEEFGDSEAILGCLEGEPAGLYLVGRNSMWHGGIHISSVTTPWCALSGKGASEAVDFPTPYKGEQSLRCMADGEVVAYRVCKDYLEAPWTSGNLSYSGSFVLIRHYLQPGEDKKNGLTFYTLYMHLAPWSAYQADKGETTWKVNEKVGLSAYEDLARTVRKGTLPNGTKVRWDESDEALKTQTDKGRIYGHVTLDQDVNVKAHGKTPEKKLFSQGEQVWVLVDRTNLKTTAPVIIPPAWWAHFQPPSKVKLEFEKVICPDPFRINAKDPVGHLGYYQNPVKMGYVPRYQAHIECLSADENLPNFLTNPEKIEQKDRPLYLKYTPGLARYNKDLSTSKFIKETQVTRTTGIATLTKVKSSSEAAEGETPADTYYQIYPEGGWLAKSNVKLLSRYDLAELGFTLTDDTPQNFDKLDGRTPPENLVRKILDILHHAAKQDTRIDYALLPNNYQRLIDLIDTNSGGYYSPDEYRQAIHNPTLRDTLFRIIARHPSEWYYKPTDSLWASYLDKMTRDAPEWKKYNEAVIGKLVWMQDLDQSKVALGPALYHMHPVVFLGSVQNPKKRGWAHSPFANLLGNAESNNNYNAYNGSKIHGYRPIYYGTLIDITLSDVMTKQQNKEIFATGRFQIIRDTLSAAVKKTNINTENKYDEGMQDYIFEEYLIKIKRPNIINYLEKNGDIEAAMYSMAQEWAAVGLRKGQLKNKTPKLDKNGKKQYNDKKQIITEQKPATFEGESFYNGDGINHASIMPDTLKKHLEDSKNYYI